RDHDEPRCPRRLRRPRESQRVADVYAAHRIFLRPMSLAQPRAEATESDLTLQARQLPLQLLELHDPVGEPGMLTPQRTSGDRKHARNLGRIEQRIEEARAH